MCLLGERHRVLVGSRNGGSNAAPPFPVSKHSFFLPLSLTNTHIHWPSPQNTQSKNSLQGGVGPAIIITCTSCPPLPRKGTRLMLFLVQAIKKLFVTCLALMFGPLAQDYRAPWSDRLGVEMDKWEMGGKRGLIEGWESREQAWEGSWFIQTG